VSEESVSGVFFKLAHLRGSSGRHCRPCFSPLQIEPATITKSKNRFHSDLTTCECEITRLTQVEFSRCAGYTAEGRAFSCP
jgi:hypothetical protein